MKKLFKLFTVVFIMFNLNTINVFACSSPKSVPKNSFGKYNSRQHGKYKPLIKSKFKHRNKKVYILYDNGFISWDENKGHGNDPDRCDGDNPGNSGKCIKENTTKSTTASSITPESDWIIKKYEPYGSRPVMIERAIDPNANGVVYDKLSDGSYNIFEYDEEGRVVEIYNEEWDHSVKHVYNEDGEKTMTISDVSWEEYSKDYDMYITTFENGKESTRITKNHKGEILVNRSTYNENGVKVDYQRSTQATQGEKTLFNSTFNK